MSDTNGYVHNFELYAGNAPFPDPGEPDLGAFANVITRLCRILPSNMNYKIYYDNHYSSLPLFVYLYRRGIYALGTFRRDRIPNLKMPADKVLKKEPRGTYEERIAQVLGAPLSVVCWNDSNIVHLFSTYAGAQPEGIAKRFDRAKGKSINVKCPNNVKIYNQHMGGVDLCDAHIGRSRITIRSRKWHLKLFFHMIDMICVNAFLCRKKRSKKSDDPGNKICSLIDFKENLSTSLCKIGIRSMKGSTLKENIKEPLLIQRLT